MNELKEVALRFRRVRALSIGDAMIDRYYFGHADRLSPEAPVPIFVHDREEDRQGGAANVSHQLLALGVRCDINHGPHPCIKRRYICNAQQVFRIDEDHFCIPSGMDIMRLCGVLSRYDVVVISDYAKGWVSSQLAEEVIRVARGMNLPVVVDPKGRNWDKYLGCTLICPNHLEMANCISDIAEFEGVLLKRGPDGMSLLLRGKGEIQIASHARHVYDVTGAGDTVVAVAAAAIGARATLEQAARLASMAAGVVVGEVGTAVCSIEKLMELIDEQ